MGKKPNSKASPSNTIQSKKPNPFDLKVNKSKFDILNKNIVGSKGNPTKAKAKAQDIRMKSLVPELGRRGRTGNFIDRRFGERNRNLSTEEKMIERFSRERIRVNKKKATFNLNDDTDDYSHTLTLTHHGKNIDDIESFDSNPEDSDADSDGGLDGHTVGYGHFGGPDGGRRSKAEIMHEVISKSKMHKFERQRIKEENAALCDDLDANFHSILHALEPRDSFTERTLQAAQAPDEYNEAVKAMAFDKRSKPSDRTKTEEELIRQKQDKDSKALEAQRKRMYEDMEADADLREDEQEDYASGSSYEEKDLNILRVRENIYNLLDELLSSSSLTKANDAYKKLLELSRTNSVIQVGIVLRERMSEASNRIFQSLHKKIGPKMPNLDELLLFHFIGMVFSTSDFHHIIVTPAQHLMTVYLATGRLLKRRHLMSALFLIQTLTQYQRASKRFVPEMFSLLGSLLLKCCSGLCELSSSQYTPDRFMSQSVHEFLVGSAQMPSEVRSIGFKDLLGVFEDEDYLTIQLFESFLLNTLQTCVHLYQDNIAAPEIFLPLLDPLCKISSTSNFAQPLRNLIEGKKVARVPLLFQKFKPISIPQLNPELDDKPTREEREVKRLHRVHKREMKGAKKELQKDSAFLARHKLNVRLEADRKYQERQRQIMGTISNDGALNQQRKRRKQ